MLVIRWLRIIVRFGLGAALLAPVAALPLSVLWDRGPGGDTRTSAHLFRVVLWLFDDFAWTCARNSVFFAIIVSLLSLALGSAFGWIVARRRFWGRGLLRMLVFALLAVSPALLALGLRGLWGSPRPWPWPWSIRAGGIPGVSLESWSSLPLWTAWIWTTLPWGVALVALVTSASVEQLEPSWEYAARLTGVGSFRAWRALFWPLVRPSSARAAALVFVFALAEPGAPLVLGLRRTLAFQIVTAAGLPDPCPAMAVWAMMTGLFGLVGWIAWHWAGGTPILEGHTGATAGSRSRELPARASRVRDLMVTVLVAGSAMVGWLPVVGLVKITIAGRGAMRPTDGGAIPAIAEQARLWSDPMIARILVNSLLLGVEVACVTIVVAWLAGPTSPGSRSLDFGARIARLVGNVPPILQGVGILALSWLAGLGSASLADLGGWRQLAVGLGSFSAWIDPARNPWVTMSCCVIVALLPRFLKYRTADARTGSSSISTSSAFDAALLAGASRSRAARLSQPWARGRWVAAGVLVGSLGATNLSPALLFQPWSDGLTIAPAVVRLAAAPGGAQSQSAALALCAIAINLAALCVARAFSVLPRSLDLD